MSKTHGTEGENVTYGELASASDSSAPFESGTGLEEAGDELTVNLLVAPGPGEECELCHEDAPTEDALRMRAWRLKAPSSAGPGPDRGRGVGTHGTGKKRKND